jgi:hypothetical protein
MVDNQASARERASFANEKEATHAVDWKGAEMASQPMRASVVSFSCV